MRIIVTGANGFVGKALVARLLGQYDSEKPMLEKRIVNSVCAIDINFDAASNDPRLEQLVGGVDDPAILDQAFASPVTHVFHLAGIHGGMAEANYALGRQVNLDATLALLEKCAGLDEKPVFVFTSTIAVFGSPMPNIVNDETPFRAQLSYATQKIMGELLIADFNRRGWIDGRSVRLSGIVARPPGPSGLMSAFMSDIITYLSAGRPFHCPLPAAATGWFMSRVNIVEALLWAATVQTEAFPESRAVTLPALRCSMGELAEAIGQAFDVDISGLVSFEADPDERLMANFGCYPPLETAAADAAGFTHDGNLENLVKRAVLNLS